MCFEEAQADDAAKRITPERRADYEAAVSACPEPYWHTTHHYCPVCPWNETGSPLGAAASGETT